MSISFIMPAYNYAQYIGYAIGSIMDRNFEDGDELVICDDASTDNTVAIVEQMREKWPQIKIVSHEGNKGGGAARNTAIKSSGNEVIFCLDADNVLVPNSVPGLRRFLLDNEADVAAFRGLHYFGAGPEAVAWPMDIVTIEHYLHRGDVPGSSGNYMYTRESWERVGGYPEDTWLDTWGFGFKQVVLGSKVMVKPDGYYLHRRGHHSYYMRGLDKGSLSEAALPILRDFLHLFSKDDVAYIMNTGDWFENMKHRPLRLA